MVSIAQSIALAPPRAHVYPAGRLSVRVTLWAVPVPTAFELLTTIVNTASLPALMLAPSGVFTTVTSGHWTVTDEESSSPPSLPVVTIALLFTWPQLAEVVVPWIWTLKLVLLAMTAASHVRTSGFGAVLIEQEAVAVPVGASASQVIPAGRLSVTCTPVALPAPVFVTVIVNPIGSPALIVALSAVFVRTIVGQLTVMSALASFGNWPSSSLVAETTTTLWSGPQLT